MYYDTSWDNFKATEALYPVLSTRVLSEYITKNGQSCQNVNHKT